MLCLRCRALPSLRTSTSNLQSPMTRITQFTPQPFASSITSNSRQFSSLLSTPTRPQQPHPQTLRTSLLSPTSSTSIIPSLLSQQTQQTRAFSATASLGVRRNTFRPSRRVQKRRHGFLSRNTTRKGRLNLTRRRLKGRRNMSW